MDDEIINNRSFLDDEKDGGPTKTGEVVKDGAADENRTRLSAKKKIPLPRLYVAAAKALSARLDGKDQLKAFIFRQGKVRNLGRLQRIVCQAHQNYANLISTLKKAGFSFDHCDERLAAVIAADVAFSDESFQPKSENFKIRAIVRLKSHLQELKGIKAEPDTVTECPVKYAHVNKLKTTCVKLKKKLAEHGYLCTEFVPPDGLSASGHASSVELLDAYYSHLRALKIFEYCWDLHFPKDLLVFNVKSNIQCTPLFRQRHIFLYNKSVVAAVKTLSAQKGDKVLDACSAPGNKATLIAQSGASVICCERAQKRYKILCENLVKSGASKRCQPYHVDFLQLEPDDKGLQECGLALVDPSCSGGTDFECEVDENRVEKLANLQTVCLKKALSLPSVHSVVYSTCSRTPRENEGVVKEVLEWASSQPKRQGNWVLENALPTLPYRANEASYPGIGHKCIFFDEKRSLTSVQFIAKFRRTMSGQMRLSQKGENAVEGKMEGDPNSKIKLKRLRQKQRKRLKERTHKQERRRQQQQQQQ